MKITIAWLSASFGAVALSMLPLTIVAALFFLAAALFYIFISDYVVIVMFKERIPLLKAIPAARGILFSNIGAFIKYIIFQK